MVKFLSLVALATLVAACASNDPPRGGGAPARFAAGGGAPTVYTAPDALLFVEFDADRDLRVTFDELVVGADAAWQAISRGQDKTGYVEVQEWLVSRLGASTFPITIMSFDQNYDSAVTGEEFKTELRRRFLLRDDDLDRVVTRAELVDEATQSRRIEQPARAEMPMGGPQRRR